jgi:hypothetical protein
MAVAATGAVMGYVSKVASAEGGYDIPAGVNPVTQLHKKEMVLPAKHADVIRSMAGDGVDGGGAQGATVINFHVNTIDSRGMNQLLKDNAGGIAKALQGYQANR